jgi:uncharacterized protein
MYTQLYFHPVRRIYDIHLKEFLKEWLPQGQLPTKVEDHLAPTDNDVLAAIAKAARDPGMTGHEPARKIARREHFRTLYKRNPSDQTRNKLSVDLVYKAMVAEFGNDAIRIDRYVPKSKGINFPVLTSENRIESSVSLSETLEKVPAFSVGTLFVHPDLRKKAKRYLHDRRDTIIPIDEQQENIRA